VSGQQSHQRARAPRQTNRRLVPYQWLGAGAVSLGIGAALAGGTAVAHADAGSGSASGGSSTDRASAASSPGPKATAKPPRTGSAKTGVSARVQASRAPNSLGSAKSKRPVAIASDSSGGQTPGAPSAEVLAAALAATTRRDTATSPARSAAVANAPAEIAREKAVADINMSVGWVPGVGTVVNGLSLVSDFADLTLAALRGDAADMRDEIQDMAVDVVGMIPVIGAPLAATIHRARVPVPTPINHGPKPVDDSYTVNEDTQLTGNVLTNDTDADGDTLTATVATGPSHGSLTLDANGSFTYVPTENYYGADGFTYTVSDGNGHTAVGTATITVKAHPPVVDQQQPYTVDGVDSETGTISGHFNVTHDKPLTYQLTTGPDPTLGVFELDEQTGEWTFTPNPRTRVLAGYFEPNSPAAVKLSITVIATDGAASTAPIAVDEHIAGADHAALALPAGTTPMLSFVDPRTGDAYVFGYSGDPNSVPGDETFSYLAALVHADGSYHTLTGNHVVGAAYETFTVGDTTYLMTLTGTPDSGFQTHLSEVGPGGLTPVGNPLPGVGPRILGDTATPATFVAGDTTYIVTVAVDGQALYLTGRGADGFGPTTSVPGRVSPHAPIVFGDTTFLLTITGDYDAGYQTHITALTPDGVTLHSVPGSGYRDPIVIGEKAYLVTETGDFESGYETHVTTLGPGGVTATVTVPGDVERDPIVIGDTTYLVTQSGHFDSGYDTNVLALTSSGAITVGTIPGALTGDPIMVGGTTYLLSQTGGNDPATSKTWVTTLAPTLGGVTLVGDPILSDYTTHIVVGADTYLLARTWSSSVGYQTSLIALRSNGLVPVGTAILGQVTSDPILVVGDTTYLVTTTEYYYTADWTYAYSRTFLTAVEPGGPTTGLDPIPGYPSGDPIVIGDATYLVMEERDPSTGYRTYLMAVTSDGVTQAGDPIPGRVNPANELQVITVGDTTYLLTTTGNDDTGYQTHLSAVTSDGVTQAGDPIPGRVDTINGETFQTIVVGDTTYLVTLTGEYDTVSTYFTALGPAGVIGPAGPIPGEVHWFPGDPLDDWVFVVGETTYVLTVEHLEYAENSYTYGPAHLMALTPTGAVQVSDDTFPGGVPSVTVVGNTTYVVMVPAVPGSDSQTYVVSITPENIAPTVTAFPGPSYLRDPIVVVGDTTYVLTTQGMWAIGVDHDGTLL